MMYKTLVTDNVAKHLIPCINEEFYNANLIKQDFFDFA